MYQIVNCSPKAAAQLPKDFIAEADNAPLPVGPNSKASKYPFRRMKPGHCFIVPFAETNERTENQLRKAVSNANKTVLGSKFVCIKHAEYACYEIARIG